MPTFRPEPVTPAEWWEIACRHELPVVVADFWLSARIRSHMVQLAPSGESYVARSIAEALQWLHNQDIHRCLLIGEPDEDCTFATLLDFGDPPEPLDSVL